jgi:hypothetical protein
MVFFYRDKEVVGVFMRFSVPLRYSDPKRLSAPKEPLEESQKWNQGCRATIQESTSISGNCAPTLNIIIYTLYCKNG